ncbi:MAG: malto-oligosyltrehalose trehalohydrolase [Thermoanaerobaculia bacterium]
MRPVQSRRYPIGAEVQPGGVHFRVWAPRRERVSVVVDDAGHELERDRDGYFAALVSRARAGARYGFLLDDDRKLYPDPASRWQPDGPDGSSVVIDPGSYEWRDAAWKGIHRDGAVISEVHIGTFTPEGTWAAAERHLEQIRDAGITVVEVMPVCEFPGRFGWGYDGVDLFAPARLYGTPDEFRRFVDTAHRLGLGVILDVVYNHVGPSGNYLPQFSPYYFTKRYKNEWGEAMNFDGECSGPVREFFVSNAAYWIDEFHLDGLRIDATQSIYDRSDVHVLAVMTRRARAAAGERTIFLVAENEPQDVRMVTPIERGGYGLDAMWNDDFHHSARVALTGRIDGYYHDYRGTPQELVSMAKHGFLYQGQWYTWQKQRRGTSSIGWPPRTFVWYLQNHDQIANSAAGDRLPQLTDPASFRAATALLLLGPATPMLFQGQEFGASSPFLYFADHEPELAKLVEKGRKEFLEQFDSLATAEVKERLPSPHDPDVFARCKLDWNERERHAPLLDLHRDLLRIRRDDPPFPARDVHIDGAVLAERAFVLRALHHPRGDRLLLVNLGEALRIEPVAEPLLAAPAGQEWDVIWSSESPRYGGSGTPHVLEDGPWQIPARCALLMSSCTDGRAANPRTRS